MKTPTLYELREANIALLRFAAFGLVAALLLAALSFGGYAFGGERAGNSRDEACLPAAIRTALDDVRLACGPIDVLSTLRPHARVPGGHVSLHASCAAADFRPRDYGCAYRVLAAWPHGLSVDGWRMRHIHISAPGVRNEGRFRHRKRGKHS